MLLRIVIIGIFLLFLLFCVAKKQDFVSPEEFNWLKTETTEQLQGCQLLASDGTMLYTPDGKGNYAALWTRDFSYMVENAFDFIETEHIKAAIEYLLAGQRADGCIPDRVQGDGLAVYSAGPVNNPLGDPPTDNSQFIVLLIYNYIKHTGDLDFFRSGSQPNCDKIVAAMNFTPRTKSGLVFINPEKPHSPYGFTDTIAKTGELLFSSLLYWEASEKLATLFNKIDNHTLADDFRNRAKLIEMNLDKLWDEKTGMFWAASEDCRQIDIWGNAYAVYIHFPLKGKRRQIVNYLKDSYNKIVFKGQIRHLPAPEVWQKTLIPIGPGTYQNGAYWGTAAGWVAYALAEDYPELAKKIFHDLIVSYRTVGAFECINSDYTQLKNYVASVTNPLGALLKL